MIYSNFLKRKYQQFLNLKFNTLCSTELESVPNHLKYCMSIVCFIYFCSLQVPYICSCALIISIKHYLFQLSLVSSPHLPLIFMSALKFLLLVIPLEKFMLSMCTCVCSYTSGYKQHTRVNNLKRQSLFFLLINLSF